MGQGIEVPLEDNMRDLPESAYTFGIRSNHLFLSRNGERDALIQTQVELAEINGSETFIHFNHAGTRLVAQENGIHPYRIGATVTLYIDPGCLFVFDLKGNLVASPSLATTQKRHT